MNNNPEQTNWAQWLLVRCVIGLLSLVLAACGSDSDDGSADVGDTPGDGDETVNTAPQFTSEASASAGENQTDTGLVVTADDPEGDELTLSVSGGADQGAFTLDTSSGALSFQSAPDFEAPADSDQNNDYEVELEVLDGNGGIAAQTVTVTVTNVNESPQFTSATLASTEENQTGTGLTVMADDPEGDELTFSVSGGADGGAFTLDGGALNFQSAPDFEVPADSDENNDYQLELQVSDGNGGTATQMVTVSVTDTASIESVSVSAGDQPKELRLSWVVGDPAARYRIEVNPDGASGFEPADVNGDGQVDESDTVSDRDARLDTQESQLLALNNVSPQAGEMGRQVDIPLDLISTDFNNALYRVVALAEGGGELASIDDISLMEVPTEGLIGYFKASNTDGGDFFGNSVALSSDGTTLAIGARGTDAVYVFTQNEAGVWSQEAFLKASNTDARDQFGTNIALSGDGATLAVGAPGESSAATGIDGDQSDNSAEFAGAVYVFTRDQEGAWSQQAYIKASNTNERDLFGGNSEFNQGVALTDDGNTLAVGATGESSAATGVGGDQSENSARDAGAVYVFTRTDQGTWSQQAYIKASNTDAGDRFGFNVGISGDDSTLAVGAINEASAATGIDGDQGDNGTFASGAAYVFIRDETGAWSQQAYIKASNTGAEDLFGWNIGISWDGSTLVAGALNEDSGATGVGGNQNDNSASNAGAAYIFTRSEQGDWSQQAYIKASNPDAEDLFGENVAISGDGDTVAVGALSEASAATGINGDQTDNSLVGESIFLRPGAVYVFTRDEEANWSQKAYVKASNTDVGDRFRHVTLNNDGTVLAVGADSEDSAATGIGGDQSDNSAPGSGAVYLY